VTGVARANDGLTPPLLRLATRGSTLALAQAGLAAAALRAHAEVRTEIVVIRTRGDVQPSTPVSELPGEGWFTSELENALLDGRADAAVHSAKDLPSTLASGLRVVAHLERGDPRDALVLRTEDGLAPIGGIEDLPQGATVGTSSPRREAWLHSLRPDLRIVAMRGNVDTRLRKLDDGEIDAMVLACAGLDRIGRGDRATVRLDPQTFVPAPAQGAVAIECREDADAGRLIAAADHPATTFAVVAERTVLDQLGGGCRLPLGAWARRQGDALVLTAALAPDGGGPVAIVDVAGDPASPRRLGAEAARRLREP